MNRTIRGRPTPTGTARSGVVLVVVVGFLAVLAGLTFALFMRVSRQTREIPVVTKTAQAYLMMQAARVYLSGRWLDATPAGRACLAAQNRGLFVHQVAMATTTYQWTNSGSFSLTSGSTITYPLPRIQETGWFGFTKDATTGNFLVLGVGGAGFRGGSLDDVRGVTDVRIYGVYNPRLDTYAEVGTTPSDRPGWNDFPWMPLCSTTP